MTRRRLVATALALAALSACGLLRRGDGAPPTEVLDLNSAPLSEVERLPGVTPSMARRIVDGRPYAEPEELVERGILTPRELERVEALVRVPERPR
jgi:DNA uptake protein ComE-like DNA-binding protein